MPFGPGSRMGVPVEKPKHFRITLRRPLGYFQPMRWQLVAVLLAAIVGTVFNVVGPKILGLATTKKFEGLPLRFYDTKTHGELMSRGVNDLDSISSTLQQTLTQAITSAVTIVGV